MIDSLVITILFESLTYLHVFVDFTTFERSLTYNRQLSYDGRNNIHLGIIISTRMCGCFINKISTHEELVNLCDHAPACCGIYKSIMTVVKLRKQD